MNKVKIVRKTSDVDGTFGKLFFNGQYVCRTGELPEKAGDENVPNEQGIDCIPRGTYYCELRESPKFGLTYWVKDVPGRQWILIHKGNFCGDKTKGRKADVEGCIVVGTDISHLGDQKAVINSGIAFKEFMKVTNNEPFELTIE